MTVKVYAKRSRRLLRQFVNLEASGGILLMGAAALALLIANSPLANLYTGILAVPFEVRLGSLELAKPLLLWINDGLMAVFFLLVGLEVKREIREGELSRPAQVILPGIAAVGGIVLPALIYIWFNRASPVARTGWAIPAATDIAFALGILYLLGSRIPLALKLFLMTVAIFDDLAAIVIIALFYSGDLSLMALGLAAIALIFLFLLNWRGVQRPAAYVIVGVLLWIFVLKSGVHATLAGVALAFAIPIGPRTEGRDKSEGEYHQHSLLHQMEHRLHPWVAYVILPIFAFANAGVPLAGASLTTLTESIPRGIIAGLFVGKQLGVFGSSWLAIRLGLARRPSGVSWQHLYGASILAGVGFTMSLFISGL
ncbi:MAG: Na+/H+ antiporter NhaA, partial [Marinobacter sp.]|uniref:Na+/H+ antiporter NhaA n=1 Tax=Marinobacter sp. TaxID=50741 RepID=UPI00299D4A40